MSYLEKDNKRYEIFVTTVFDNARSYDNEDEKWLDINEMLDRLNEQDEEIKKLSSQLNIIKEELGEDVFNEMIQEIINV